MNQRIVSLIASGTEIVSALGCRNSLVGRSHECDFPPDVSELAVCSEPRIDVHARSSDIDRQVRALVRDAMSVYSVFQDELNRLQPTLIITQSQCDICAVSLKDVQAAVREMTVSRPDVVSLEPMCLADITSDILRVAEAVSDHDAGTRLVDSMRQRFHRISADASAVGERPTVFCLEWLDPLMSGGNWIPELVDIAGGIPILAEAGQHSATLSWSDLVEADPDIIAVMPCGYGIDRSMQEIHLLTQHPERNRLRAVRNNRVYVTDGNHYFNRPGPRVVESAEILAEIIREPMTADDQFRHRGTGWIRLEVTADERG